MATTTSMTVATADNQTGSEHSQFHLYSSTPDSGNVYDGYGLWWVVRSGSVIHRCKGLTFGWATTTDGDIIYGQYVDSSGVAGSQVSHTISISSSWDGTIYVDPTGGSNSNDGLSTGAPKATWGGASGAYAAYTGARSSTEKWRILLKAGETHPNTSITTASWVALGTTAGHLHVGSYDTGAKPIVSLGTTGSDGGHFVTGGCGLLTLTVTNLAITGSDTTNNSIAVMNIDGSLQTGSTECGILFENCDVTGTCGGWIGVSYDESYRGRYDFAAVVGCTVTDYGDNTTSHLFFGWGWAAYLLFQRNTISGTLSSANGFLRGPGWRYACLDGNTFDRSGATMEYNVFRMSGGGDSDADDVTHRNNIYGNSFIECGEGIELEHTNDPAQCTWQDILIHGNYFTMTVGAINYCVGIAGGGGNYSGRATRIRIECNAGWGYLPMVGLIAETPATTDTGHIESVRIAHNTMVISGQGTMLLTVVGSDTIDDDSLTLTGNYCWASGSGYTSRLMAVDPAWVVASDYNHILQSSAGGIEWNTSTSLATWQGATSLDANSSSGFSATHRLTDVTQSAFDPTPTASLFTAGFDGDPGAVYLDFNGDYFDASEPDAGAIQYGATSPDEPSGGGGGGGSTLYPDTALSISIGIGI